MTSLSNNLIKLRSNLSLTQEQIASVIMVAPKTYQAWERRNIEPPIEKLILLAEFYNITVDQLINKEAKPEGISFEQKILTSPEHIKKAIISLLQI